MRARISRIRIFVANGLANRVLPKHFDAVRGLRAWVFKWIGGLRIGSNVAIMGGTYLLSSNISVGDNSYIGADCLINCNDAAHVTIGANCDVAHGVTFAGTSHEIGGLRRRAGGFTAGAIAIGDGSWVGCNATIVAGCTIGKGCIVAACSLVNSDVRDNVMVAGVPATIKKELPLDEMRTISQRGSGDVESTQ